MIELLLVAGVALLAFLSTNLDSLVVLVPLLAERQSALRVAGGYWLAVIMVVLASWLGARVADALIPTQWIGYLGVVPLALGAMGLWRAFRATRPETTTAARAAGVLSTCLTILALSGDNLGVFIPLFADKPARHDPIVLLTLVSAALAWVGLAAVVSRLPLLRRGFERWGPRAVPILMILLGIHILMNTASDVT